mgnify:CR=1 FL=1
MSSDYKMKISESAPFDSLPVIGKSWRTRGAVYWAGRTAVAIFLLLMTVMVFAMAFGVTIGVIDAGAPPWIIIPVAVLASAASSIWTARSIIRKQRQQENPDDRDMWIAESRGSDARIQGRRAAGGAGAFGSVLGALGGIGTFLLAICTPIAVGIFPVILWCWLKPLAPGELRARHKIARWLALHDRADEIPAGWDRP